ncbi:MAG: tyrosine-type recombinase/integrase [Promethearchaeota archaeon]
MSKPTNEQLIQNYLNFYQHSPQSVKMRKACLNYFFNDTITNLRNMKKFKTFGYKGHVFDITTSKLKEYFVWLKNLDTIGKTTKKNKWAILKSFLEYTMEDHESFRVVIPKKTVNWSGTIRKNGEINSNKKVYATKEEIQQILTFFRKSNFKHYLIIRTLVETGARKGEIIHLKVNEVNIKERYINPHVGKTGEKFYFFSKNLADNLEIYMNERMKIKTDSNAFFLSHLRKQYSSRSFNLFIENARKNLGITKRITCHTFRKTINDFRKEMGCSNEDRKILLGHAVSDVNVASYTNKDIEKIRNLADIWNPYKEIDL